MLSRLADVKSQWFQDNFPGATMDLGPQRTVAVLHTTEGLSWPTYEGGATAPNLTGLPPIGLRRGKWRQHFPFNKSSRALANLPGGVETNTLNAIQIELIGTCDPKHADSWDDKGLYFAGKDYVFWPKATKRQKNFVARMLADISEQTGLRLTAPKEFLPYPRSYGSQAGNRLSFESWRQTTGVVGHQHVPENNHGDPGNLDVEYILKKARKIKERRGRRP